MRVRRLLCRGAAVMPRWPLREAVAPQPAHLSTGLAADDDEEAARLVAEARMALAEQVRAAGLLQRMRRLGLVVCG